MFIQTLLSNAIHSHTVTIGQYCLILVIQYPISLNSTLPFLMEHYKPNRDPMYYTTPFIPKQRLRQISLGYDMFFWFECHLLPLIPFPLILPPPQHNHQPTGTGQTGSAFPRVNSCLNWHYIISALEPLSIRHKIALFVHYFILFLKLYTTIPQLKVIVSINHDWNQHFSL